MRQVLSLVYYTLIDGKTPAQIAELDVSLSDPEDKDRMIARQNQEAMKQLVGMGGHGMLKPPPPGRSKKQKVPPA